MALLNVFFKCFYDHIIALLSDCTWSNCHLHHLYFPSFAVRFWWKSRDQVLVLLALKSCLFLMCSPLHVFFVLFCFLASLIPFFCLSPSPFFSQKSRPQSAGSSGKPGSGQGGKTGMAGLNSEEIKIVRRIKEEEQRRGGWIRIFPGPDTWDVHG